MLMTLFARQQTAYEIWCTNPCSALNGDVERECSDCVGDKYACKGSELPLPAVVLTSPSLAVDALGHVEPIRASLALETKLSPSDPASPYDFDAWRRCLPAKSDVPHAHDDVNTNHNSAKFNVSCLLEHHVSYFGEQFLPRHGFQGLGEAATLWPPQPGCDTKLGHNQSFGHQGQRRKQLAEVTGCLDSLTFMSDYVRPQQPVVMRGCGVDHPAFHNWRTDAYLERVAGEWANPDFGTLGEWLHSYKQTNNYGARPIEDMRDAAPAAPAPSVQ